MLGLGQFHVDFNGMPERRGDEGVESGAPSFASLFFPALIASDSASESCGNRAVQGCTGAAPNLDH